MKYRIVEFKETDLTGDKFFVEVGTVVSRGLKKLFNTDIVWEKDIVENKVLGHKTFSEAMERIKILKNAQPIYHEIQ